MESTMIVLKVSDILNVDTISQEKVWVKIIEACNNIISNGNDVMIDFQGITIVDPQNSQAFKDLIKNKHVFLKLYDDKATAHKIELMYIIDGINTNDNGIPHIQNIENLKEVETTSDKKLDNISTEIAKLFEVRSNIAKLDVSKRFDSIHSNNTLKYIDAAIEKVYKKHKCHIFILKINIPYSDFVVMQLADIMIKYMNQGIDVQLDTDDKNLSNNIQLAVFVNKTKNLSIKDKINVFKNIPNNTFGILLRYRSSRAVDSYGRYGNGEVVSAKIARFIGLQSTGSETTAIIEEYARDKFYTRVHLEVINDGSSVVAPSKVTRNIDIKALGYCEEFLGTSFHFISPVQRDISENVSMIIGLDENGNNIKKEVTIPERIKLVADDFNIDYDEESLNRAIEETRKNLGI